MKHFKKCDRCKTPLEGWYRPYVWYAGPNVTRLCWGCKEKWKNGEMTVEQFFNLKGGVNEGQSVS